MIIGKRYSVNRPALTGDLIIERGISTFRSNDRHAWLDKELRHNVKEPPEWVLLEYGANPKLKDSAGEAPQDSVTKCNRLEAWDPTLPALASLYSG